MRSARAYQTPSTNQPTNQRSECDTCYYSCYTGTATLDWGCEGELICLGQYEPSSRKRSRQTVVDLLEADWAIGQALDCVVDKESRVASNPGNEVHLNMFSTQGELISGIVFLALGVIACAVGAILMRR
jgi:hypothetical protein